MAYLNKSCLFKINASSDWVMINWHIYIINIKHSILPHHQVTSLEMVLSCETMLSTWESYPLSCHSSSQTSPSVSSVTWPGWLWTCVGTRTHPLPSPPSLTFYPPSISSFTIMTRVWVLIRNLHVYIHEYLISE